MKAFFVSLSSWGTSTPHIIDETALEQAERGENYLDPNGFDFLCEAETMKEAFDFYFNELSEFYFGVLAEAQHP